MKCGAAVGAWSLVMLALFGCGGAPPRDLPPRPSITVSYAAGPPAAIEIIAVNALALHAAELVTRNGRVLGAAAGIERETLQGTAAPQPTFGVGVFGGSHGVEGAGIGIGLPVGGIAQPPPPGPVRARARVPLDDVDAYRRDWADLAVRLRFGRAPGPVSIADIPAPAPR